MPTSEGAAPSREVMVRAGETSTRQYPITRVRGLLRTRDHTDYLQRLLERLHRWT